MRPSSDLILILIAFSPLLTTASGYTNHTVGGPAGWFFNGTTNTSSTNYSTWVATQTFALGDYLLFNTNTNQTVIQTYDLSTYEACSIDNASDSSFFQYSGGSSQFGESLTVTVPLTVEGPKYYFSDADDGIQCLNGMQFTIDVKHGAGLPPYLNQPPPPPYAEPPGSDAAQQPPVTVTPAGNRGSRAGANVREAVLGALVLVLIFQSCWG